MLNVSRQRDHDKRFYYLLFDGDRPVGSIEPIGGFYWLYFLGNELDYGKYATFEAARDMANKLHQATL